MKKEKYNVTGMTCAACQANVTRCVQKLEGVEEVDVSLLANQMTVRYDETKLDRETILQSVQGIGYGASLTGADAKDRSGGFRSEWESRQSRAEEERRSMKVRLTASVILLIPLMYVAMGAMMGLPVPGTLTGMENAMISALTQLILTIPILVLNRKFYKVGLKALVKRAPNMDSLVAIGSGASLVYGLFAMYRMAWGFFLLGAVLFFIGAAMSMMQVEEISVACSAAGIVLAAFGIYMGVESWDEDDPQPEPEPREDGGHEAD